MAQVVGGIKSLGRLKGLASWRIYVIAFFIWMFDWYAYLIINGSYGSFLTSVISVPIINIISIIPFIGGLLNGIFLVILLVMDFFLTLFIIKICNWGIVHTFNLAQWLRGLRWYELVIGLIVIIVVLILGCWYYGIA